MMEMGYLLDSGNRSGIGLVGRSAWTAADAHVRLLAGRPGAGGGRGRPLRMTPQNTGYLSQVDTPTTQNHGTPRWPSFLSRRYGNAPRVELPLLPVSYTHLRA